MRIHACSYRILKFLSDFLFEGHLHSKEIPTHSFRLLRTYMHELNVNINNKENTAQYMT